MKYILFIVLVSVFVSCSNSQKVKIDNSEITFFDFKDFFEKEIEGFSFSKIKKTVTLDDNTETQELSDFDIKKELELFTKANISRPAWKDKYQVEASASKEIYTAMDDKLTIREVIVEKNGDDVSKISIQTLSNNTIFEAAKNLIYEPNKGFLIENTQDVMLAGNHTMKIEVVFLGE